MDIFAKNLNDLMKEKTIDIKTLSKQLDLADGSAIYKWLKGELSFLLPTAVKIANFFDCSLDYLFGRSDKYENGSYKECPPFDLQFRKILDEQKVSQYRIIKDKIFSKGNIDSWLNKKQTPHIESVIKLADYLKISIDYLVGREK